jgi:transcriptional regulator with XRE-family HTH domain
MEGIPRLKQNFGKVICQLRSERGESQQVVADNCNLERAYVSRLERGLSEPSISTIFRIAEYFEITPADLVEKVYLLGRRSKK